MQIRKGGAWRTTASAQAYINGAWRTILNGKCFKGGKWRDACNFTVPTPTPSPTPTPTPGLSLAVSPSSSYVISADPIVVSDPITATPSGGAAPYNYVWSIVYSDGHSFTITPNSATTAVRATLTSGATASCTIHCVCTDNTGLTGTSPLVPITLQRPVISGPLP
jgi:hypothetical protein